MHRFFNTGTTATWVLSGLLLLSSCRVILDIKTNEVDLDCKVLTEDSYCIKVRTAEIESVTDLTIDQDKILTNDSGLTLSWKMPATAKRILSTKIILASDTACKVEVTSAEVAITQLSYAFTNIKDGIYYGCVFANAKSALLVGAKNNGIKIIVEAAGPQLQPKSSVIYTNGRPLEQVLDIKAVSGVKYLWTKVSGVGELSFSDAHAAAPTITASAQGIYIIEVTITNEVGGQSKRRLSIIYDTIAPIITAIAPINTSANSVAIKAESEETLSDYRWEIISAPTGASPVLKDGNTASVEVSLPSLGDYMLKVSLTDDAGNTGSTTVNVSKVTPAALVMLDTIKPTAPSAITMPSFSNATSVTATYNAGTDTNFSTHNVKACTSINCSTGCLAASQDVASPVTLNSLVNSSSYYVCLQAVDVAGNISAYIASEGMVTIDTTNPGDPSAVSVPASSNAGLDITFTIGTEINRSLFNIKACTSGCTTGCVGATTTAVSPGTISGSALTNGNSYRGCVQATDLAGNTSAWVPSAGLSIFDTTLPNAPFALTVPAYSNSTSVAVSFTPGTDANMSTHTFKACTSIACSTGCLGTVTSATSPVTLASLVHGTAYYACGQAVDLAGNSSAFSNSAATVTIDTVSPGNPTAVSVPATSANGIAISFTGGTETNASNFNIKACLNNTCNVGCVGATTTASSPGTIASAALSNGTSYYGCVQGADLAGNTSGFVASAATVAYSFVSTTYNGNGSTGGSVPTDATQYASGATVTVLGNTGSLVKSGYTFGGWNAIQNSGTSTASFTISSNTTLYAQWSVDCTSLAGGTYVMVPGDSIYGTSSFCVQKYAASNVANVATAQAGTAPWAYINQTDSIAKCASLGAGYHLLTNPEWMSIAANLANVGSNWSTGTVGSGTLRRGHSDSNPNNPCAANGSDANGYVETDCIGTSSGAFVERRTSSLSNGSIVWDFSGNIWHWVNYNNSADKPTPATFTFYEYTAITGSTTTPKSHLVPLNSAQSWWSNSWNSTQGIGRILPDSNGSGGALLRGSASDGGVVAGAFAASLNFMPSWPEWYVGFRCAYTPATFAVTYDANSGTSGSPPNDPTLYASGNTVTVKGNTIALARSGYVHAGWNTASNGSGTSYTAGQTFTISANTILYAKWSDCTGLAGGTWVVVPGDSIYGTDAFCVQKYAASNVSSVPTSQSGTAPWVNIDQTTSISTCAGLGTGFHLITNPEWMTLAANLANVGSNWSGSSVGSGTLRRGHSDGDPDQACAANASDVNAYVQTTCTGTSSGTFVERRTSTLSNGTVVWDVGGNVRNWVNYNNFADKPTPATTSYYEFTAISGSAATPKSHLVPLNSAQSWWTDSWNSAQGIGRIRPGTNGSGGALQRGANWNDATNVGAFSAFLNNDESNTGSHIGLRCTWQP